MEVEARPIGGCLLVTVQDRGRGLGGRSSDPGTGLGLRVARAVSGSFAMQQKAPAPKVGSSFRSTGPPSQRLNCMSCQDGTGRSSSSARSPLGSR